MPNEEFYADLEQMYLDDERAYWNTGPPTPNAALEREREEQTPPARAGGVCRGADRDAPGEV